MSDEIVTEKQDAKADKPQVDATSVDKGIGERVEVVVEEVFGAVGNVFEAIKDEFVEHFGDSKDTKDEEAQENVEAKDSSETEDSAPAPTTHENEVQVASGDMEPSSTPHHAATASQDTDVTDTPIITATPVANFAPAADAVDPNASNAADSQTSDTTEQPAVAATAQTEQSASPANTGSQHNDGHDTVIVETVVIKETIVQEADGTQHVEVIEAHEVAAVVEGENGESQVTVAEEYIVTSADIEEGEIYDASAADLSDDTTQEADYEASMDDVVDYEAIADTDTADTVDSQDSYDAADALETHLGDMVTYD